MKLLEYNGAVVGVFENTLTSEELYQKFEHPPFFDEELLKVSSEKRKKEILGLRWCLKKSLNIEEKVLYTPDGKPFLENSKINISFSHSGIWNAIISHPIKNVGIDIEIPSDKLKRIFRKFMNDEELQTFGESAETEILCIIWSAKEVLYKIIGKEAVDFRAQLRILTIKQNDNSIETLHIPSRRKYSLQYQITNDFVLVYGVE